MANCDQKLYMGIQGRHREGEMGSFSLTHLLVVLMIILILFGAGKLPRVMGDLAKGIKTFKAGMKDDDDLASNPAKIEEAGQAADRKT
jgi:sec-independent protein translocase protein TatA